MEVALASTCVRARACVQSGSLSLGAGENMEDWVASLSAYSGTCELLA